MMASIARMLVSAGAGLVAVYWMGVGETGLFAAIALGFASYAALSVWAVVRVPMPSVVR